jgi:YD repeat-containing protein
MSPTVRIGRINSRPVRPRPNLFSPEGNGAGQYAWYGLGYPAGDLNNPGTGSANPSDPNYSWPAFWGDRNSNNETANATVSQTYPTPGNPAGYTDPSWTIAGAWDADGQLAAVPEPSTLCLGGVAVGLLISGKCFRRFKASKA